MTEDTYKGKATDPLSLNLYAYCHNNPVRYIDPSGNVVTAWDLARCTPDEIEILYANSIKWENGNADQKKDAAASSEAIRANHRINGETGSSDGNTYNASGMKYHQTLYFDAAEIKPIKTPVVDFSVKAGTGVAANIKVARVAVEVGGKKYYELTSIASNVPTESMTFSAEVAATNKVKVGASITGTINAATQQHLYTEGFAGIKIANTTLGWDNLPNNKDITMEFGGGVYIGAGGEVSVSVNASELWRRIYNSFR